MLTLPDYPWLSWIVYVLLVVALSRQMRTLLYRLAWFKPKGVLMATRLFVYLMLLPCVIIFDWRAWLAPAIVVLLLAIVNQQIWHLLSSLLSFSLVFSGYMWWRKHKVQIHAWWAHVARPGSVLRWVLNAAKAVGTRVVALYAGIRAVIMKRWQQR